ncbi:MAG: hypothetical protein KDB80_13170 [Planctomycetes bacterium]|nr:hypothetical protein [Planctomycetota bacterium]
MTEGGLAHARRWVRWIAVACFGAGICVGLAIPSVVRAFRAETESLDPDERYARALEARYELTPEQMRALRMVLAARLAESRELILDPGRKNSEDLLAERSRVFNRADERIYALLTDEQRARYSKDKKDR